MTPPMTAPAPRTSGLGIASREDSAPRRPGRAPVKRRWGVHVMAAGWQALIVEVDERIGRARSVPRYTMRPSED